MTDTTELRDYHYPKVFKQFMGYAKGHTMTVLHDDGLYRHLRFATDGAWMGGFDLITWPGSLAIHGDIGDGWSFARVPDMLAWFNDGTAPAGHINPGYWWQKMPEALRRAGKGYSEDKFRAYVAELVTQAVERMGYQSNPGDDLDHATAVALVGDYRRVHARLTKMVEDEVLVDAHSEDLALTALRDFTFEVEDEEWSLVDDLDAAGWTDFDHHFLLACHAIHWGAGRYAREVRMPRLGKAPA